MITTTIQPVVDKLNELSDAMPFHVGWYLKHLPSGFEAERNGHVVVPSASTRKVAILMTALKQVHEGKLGLDQPVTMEAKYQNNTSGTFQHLAPGFTITLKDALTMMIIVSDNTCTGTVSDIVGLPNVQALCDSIGMTGTFHRLGIPAETTNRSPSVDNRQRDDTLRSGTVARSDCPEHHGCSGSIAAWQHAGALSGGN